MKKEVKKVLHLLGKIFGILFILFILYVFIFALWRPFMGEITQDRPIIKWLCEKQVGCDVGVGPYSCSFKGENKKLERWEGYDGCNESTYGYYSEVHYGRVYSYINVESCNCGGLM